MESRLQTSEVEAGKKWLTQKIWQLANEEGAHLEKICWNETNDRYEVILEGLNKQRVIKLISLFELCSCCEDVPTQGELITRLSKMMSFFRKRKD